jgi:hypothetical protein
MSYEIIYDKQFIKLETPGKPVRFIPMIYAGSNNCYEHSGRGRGRRARDWSNFTHLLSGKQFGTEKEMLERQQQERQSHIDRKLETNDEYRDDRFGYFAALQIGTGHTTTTSFAKYQGIVRTGCRKALTIEQLRENGISLRIYTAFNNELKADGIEPIHLYPKTTQECIEMLEQATVALKDTKHNFYLSLSASERDMKRLRQKYFPKQRKEKEIKEVKQWWTIRVKGFGDLVRLTGSGFKYSQFGSGKKYVTETEAQKRLKVVQEKLSSRYEAVVKKHEGAIRMRV